VNQRSVSVSGTIPGQKDMHNFPQRAAAGIGRSLDAVSGSWFVIPLDGRVLGIAMHVLVSSP
jgi:hypothetical protein